MLKRAILIILALFALIFVNFSNTVYSAIYSPPFTVEVNPINAGANAEYHIYGSYSNYSDITSLKVTLERYRVQIHYCSIWRCIS